MQLSFVYMNVIINLDKPKGLTSQQVVTKVKRILGVKKAGHTGTLDPIATGVLLVCIGEATKIARFLVDLDKEYVALMKLGERTDTFDVEGRVIRRVEGFSLEKRDVEQAVDRFKGLMNQKPPMYSALKINGKPLYKLARKGLEVDRPERAVMIYGIEMTAFAPPWIEIKVSCSKGTYIRTLCDDIGDVLGVGAHVAALRRTRIGAFRIDDSLTLEELEEIARGVNGERRPDSKTVFAAGGNGSPGISDIDGALRHLGELVLTDAEFARAKNGMSFRSHGREAAGEGFLRLKDPDGNLFAIGASSEGFIKIERILHVRG